MKYQEKNKKSQNAVIADGEKNDRPDMMGGGGNGNIRNGHS